MITYIILILLGVVIAGLCYYIYTIKNRVDEQAEVITTLQARFGNMEATFMRPPAADIESIFEKQSCVGDLCRLSNFREEVKKEAEPAGPEKTLDMVAEEELESEKSSE